MLLHFFHDGSPSPVTAFFASHHARTDPFSRGFQGTVTARLVSCLVSVACTVDRTTATTVALCSLLFPSDVTGAGGRDTRYDVIGDSFFTAKVTENAPAEGGRSSGTFRGY